MHRALRDRRSEAEGLQKESAAPASHAGFRFASNRREPTCLSFAGLLARALFSYRPHCLRPLAEPNRHRWHYACVRISNGRLQDPDFKWRIAEASGDLATQSRIKSARRHHGEVGRGGSPNETISAVAEHLLACSVRDRANAPWTASRTGRRLPRHSCAAGSRRASDDPLVCDGRKVRPHRAWSDVGKDTTSPLGVLRKNIVLLLHYRMACEPALGVVPLRRLIRQCPGPERIGRGVILKLGISPAAAVREPLAILHHEINVMEGTGTSG
jgi:hypothetical protein